jgi:hypothetical protein
MHLDEYTLMMMYMNECLSDKKADKDVAIPLVSSI